MMQNGRINDMMHVGGEDFVFIYDACGFYMMQVVDVVGEKMLNLKMNPSL